MMICPGANDCPFKDHSCVHRYEHKENEFCRDRQDNLAVELGCPEHCEEVKMGVKIGERGIVPNWITENDWSPKRRIEWASDIMAFSSRDWSINFNSGDTPSSPDPEVWCLWCLITSDTKEEALEAWWNFCDQYV